MPPKRRASVLAETNGISQTTTPSQGHIKSEPDDPADGPFDADYSQTGSSLSPSSSVPSSTSRPTRSRSRVSKQTSAASPSQSTNSSSQSTLFSQLQNETTDGPKQKKKKKVLLSGQTNEERMELREQYRKLYQETQENRALLADPSSKLFITVAKIGDKLNEKVVHTSEAVLDARQLELLTEIGQEQAERLKRSSLKFPDFVKAIQTHFQDRDDPDRVDLFAIGDVANRFVRSVPITSFLNGLLAIPPKERKERKQAEKRTVTGDVVQPDKVASFTNDEKTQTDSRVLKLHEHLRALKKPAPLYNFLFNPDSFTQTIENIFDLSFLVKIGHAQLTLSDGISYVGPHSELTDEDYAAGQTILSMVITMNYREFLEICKVYEIHEPWLPPRAIE